MKKVFLTLSLFFSPCVFSDGPGDIYIHEGACPFEGCSYGVWDVIKPATVFSGPASALDKLGVLEPGSRVTVLTGSLYVTPGEARIISEPYGESRKLDRNLPVYILDYTGEGRTRIFQNGNFYITKIATTRDQCIEKYDARRCWVDVIKEPESKWWVKIIYKNTNGWVLVEDANIVPIKRH